MKQTDAVWAHSAAALHTNPANAHCHAAIGHMFGGKAGMASLAMTECSGRRILHKRGSTLHSKADRWPKAAHALHIMCMVTSQ